MPSRRTPRAACAAAAVLSLAGCGTAGTATSSTPASPTPSTSPTLPSTPTTTSTPTTAATSPRPSPGIPACTSNIRVITGQSQGAAGHLALVLIFNNVGHSSCRISGYPTVDLVTASGAVVGHAQHVLSGMAGGAGAVVPVTLAAGASASALVEASDVPQGSITDCGSYALMVTPPDQAVAVPAGTAMMPRCEIQVHPVVAGTGGGMR